MIMIVIIKMIYNNKKIKLQIIKINQGDLEIIKIFLSFNRNLIWDNQKINQNLLKNNNNISKIIKLMNNNISLEEMVVITF